MVDLTAYSKTVYDIIGAAMTVHSELRWGLLEAVYQEALHLELCDRGIEHEKESKIQIYYKQRILTKKYKMDFVVGDIIVELKSAMELIPAHRAQLCNYLRLSRKPVGLLINFGEEALMGERWGYDKSTNQCFIVDRNMQPISDANYHSLLHNPNIIEEDDEF